MLTTMLDAIEWLIRAVFRLVISFIKAFAYFYLSLMLGFIVLFCVVAVLSPLGETVMVLGGVAFLILAPELLQMWRPQDASPPHESDCTAGSGPFSANRASSRACPRSDLNLPGSPDNSAARVSQRT